MERGNQKCEEDALLVLECVTTKKNFHSCRKFLELYSTCVTFQRYMHKKDPIERNTKSVILKGQIYSEILRLEEEKTSFDTLFKMFCHNAQLDRNQATRPYCIGSTPQPSGSIVE
jgi:hypothetical protein